MASTLLLNTDFRPHAILTWQEAITLLLQEKARVVAEYDDWSIKSPSLTIRVPSVLMLVKYVFYRQDVKFTRTNIFARDKYTCQYCGKQAGHGKPLSISDLTFDHVFPRSKGGLTNWSNIVTCCSKCNTKKADKTMKQAGMSLLNEPVKPKRLNNIELTLSVKSIPDAWASYLYWMQEIDQD